MAEKSRSWRDLSPVSGICAKSCGLCPVPAWPSSIQSRKCVRMIYAGSRAGLRQHQSQPWLSQIRPPRTPCREQRVAPDLRITQHAEAPAGSPSLRCRPGRPAAPPKRRPLPLHAADSCDSLIFGGVTRGSVRDGRPVTVIGGEPPPPRKPRRRGGRCTHLPAAASDTRATVAALSIHAPSQTNASP